MHFLNGFGRPRCNCVRPYQSALFLPSLFLLSLSNMAKKKSRHHLTACIRLLFSHETPRQSSSFSSFSDNTNPPAKVKIKVKVAHGITASNDGMSKTFKTVLQLFNFDGADYHHIDLFLVVNHINNLEIPLSDVSNAHVFSIAQLFRACSFVHASGTLPFPAAATAASSRECKHSTPASTPILDKASSVALLIRTHRLQTLRDPQMTGVVASVEALLLVWFVTRKDGRSIP